VNAIVTGAGRGIGAAIAERFAVEGLHVLAVSRTASELERVCARIRDSGGVAAAHAADVSRSGAGAEIVRACEQMFGDVDVLVNAAGVQGAIGRLVDVDLHAWWQVVETNLRGTVELCAAVLPGMMRRSSGVIINLSGGGATAPMPRFSAYAASKAAVVRFTETLAAELLDRGITVNAIAPGMVDTSMQDVVLAAGPDAGPEYERVQRLRQSGEGGAPVGLAAELAAALATGRLRGLTGKLISAPHDDWRSWDASHISELTTAPWLTLRRIDPFTIRPLCRSLEAHA